MQVTPAHGSPTQRPLLQPNPHVVSTGAYVQVPSPLLHVPGEAYERATLALAQTAAGGVLQVVSIGA